MAVDPDVSAKPLVLLVISLVFSALICMPKAVEVLSMRSTNLSSSLPARPSMSSAKRKFVIFLPCTCLQVFKYFIA